MSFEYDPQKSKTNKEKHGVDFETAKMLWDDPNRLIVPAKSDDENRMALLAIYKKNLWVAFFTMRKNFTRIISVRRARKGEKKIYES